MKLSWSEISNSKTFEFLKRLFQFVRIKSLQVGFADWKQVGLFIKLSWLNVFINTLRFLLLAVNLKFTSNVTFSYWHVCLLKTFDKILRKYFDGMFLSCHVLVSEWIHTLWLSECQGTSCSKQAQYLKF